MDSSLDLNGLAKSLPASNFEKAEKDMLNNFKAAALSITTLYKSSRHASKSAYNAGYAAACNDFLLMLQQGVSSGAIPSDPPHPSSYSSMSGSNQAMDPMMEHGGGMGVGRIMDWVEARLEAIKARQEEELEDEEREKERERIKSLAATAGASSSSSAMRMRKDNGAGSSSKREEGPKSDQRQGSSSMRQPSVPEPAPAPAAPMTPHSPFSNPQDPPAQPSSPTPPPAALRSNAANINPIPNPSTPSNPTIQRLRRNRGSRDSEPPPSTTSSDPNAAFPFTFTSDPSTPTLNFHSHTHPHSHPHALRALNGTSPAQLAHSQSESDIALVAGAKRRHAVMMMLDSASPSPTGDAPESPLSLGGGAGSAPSGGPRRRTRSSKAHGGLGGQAQVNAIVDSMMDVEEDGRERKRVARR